VRALAATAGEQLLQARPVEADDRLAVNNDYRDTQLPGQAHHLVRRCPVARDIDFSIFDSALVKKPLDLMTIGSGLCGVNLNIHFPTRNLDPTNQILSWGTNRVYDFCLTTRHEDMLLRDRAEA